MRPLRILGASLVILLGLLFAAAWVVPLLLDWNSYRGTIAELVSEKLGRAVRIEGPISLSLLPQPILTASRISVAEASEGGHDGVTIGLAELRLRLALGPLLSGRVDAQELELRGLDVHLPWPMTPDPIALRAPLWLSSLSARIEDGRLTVGGLAVTGIAATLGTVADTGSYALAGQAQISGLAWHMTARLSRPGADGTAGLDLSLDGQGPMQGLGAMFSGQIAADGTLGGRVSGRGPDLSRLLPAPAVPFKAEGRLTLAAGIAIADQLAMEIAGSPARGAVALRLQPASRLDVSLAASRLDLDAWLPKLLRGTATATPSLAGDLATGIDLSAEAATLGGGTLRSLRGRFELDGPNISLNQVTAMLPGDANFRLDGRITRTAADGSVHFEGPARLAAPNLRTSLAWLASPGMAAYGLGQIAELPPGVLRTASLSATVAADTGAAPRIALSALLGMVDESQIQGSLAVRPAIGAGSRLGLSGQLGFDRMELDPWFAAMPQPGLLASRASRMDLDLRLSAATARLAGHDLTKVALDVATEPGRLMVRQAEATSQGVHVATLFTLQDNLKLSDARLELQAGTEQTGPALASWLPGLAPLAARLPRDPLTLTLSGGGSPEALTLRGVADLGDLHFEAQPVLNLTAQRWTGAVMLRHPGAPRLLDSLGLPGTAAWLGDGSLSLVASLSGTLSKVVAESFDLSAGSLRANGTLTLDRSATPSLVGHINADTLPLPMPYPRSREPLQTELLAGIQTTLKLDAAHVLIGLSPVLDQASGTLVIANSAVRLEGFSAHLDGGVLSGGVSFDAAPATPRLAAELALAGATLTTPLFELPLDLASGIVDATVSLNASGHAPQALLATLSGTAHVAARNGEVSGVALDRIGSELGEASLRAALSGGATAFSQLDLDLALKNGGITVKSGSIVAGKTTATLGGLIDIAGRTAELRLAASPAVVDPPEIAVRFSGPLDVPVRTLELANAAAWRALHP